MSVINNTSDVVQVYVNDDVVTVNIINTGAQGADGSFDGFSIEGGSASTIYLVNQKINGGNA